MRFDLQDLRLVVAVARLGSITAGAAEVHLAVASASERLKALEDSNGVLLFNRMARGVKLTEAGNALAKHATAILLQSSMLERDFALIRQGLKGEISIAANSIAIGRFLYSPLTTFLKGNPSVNVLIREEASARALQLLINQKVDIAIAVVDESASDFHSRALFTDRLVAMVAADHAMADAPGVRFSDLLDFDLLAPSQKSALRSFLNHQAQLLERRPNIRAELDDVSTMCRMAAAGIGMGIASYGTAGHLRSNAGIRLVPILDHWSERRISALWSRERELKDIELHLLDCLSSAVQTREVELA